MDINLALVALVFWVAFSLAVAAYLDGRKQASRAVPVIREVHRPVRIREHRSRW